MVLYVVSKGIVGFCLFDKEREREKSGGFSIRNRLTFIFIGVFCVCLLLSNRMSSRKDGSWKMYCNSNVDDAANCGNDGLCTL